MKKAIFKGFAVAALALAVLFTGCSNDSNIESFTVGSVKVNAKAYPGFNYVSWTLPENDSANSTISIYRETDGKALTKETAGNFVIDTDIEDGVSYTYTVYVKPSTSYKPVALGSGNNDYSTGYIMKGNSASDSCTSINPICIKDGKLMTALDLVAAADDEDNIITAENIVFERETYGNNYYVAFPAKTYLTYKVSVYVGNTVEVFGIKTNDFGTALNTAGNKFNKNGSLRWASATLNPGEYTTVVEVASQNGNYQKSYITAANKFKVEALDVNAHTSAITAGYTDSKTIRLIWKPATKKSDGKDWEVGKYTVYVQDKLTGVWTALAGTPKATTEDAAEAKAAEEAAAATPAISPAKNDTQADKVVYYYDYTVPSNEVVYNFAVVLADNGMVEDLSSTSYTNKTGDVAVYGKLADAAASNTKPVAATFVTYDNDGKADDARLRLEVGGTTGNAKTLKFAKVLYKTLAKNDIANYTATELLLDSELKEAAVVPSADYTIYDVYVKNVDLDSKVVFLYTLSDKDSNKADKAYVLATSGASSYAPDAIVTGEFAKAYKSGDTDKDTYTVTVTVGSQKDYDLYDYAVYYAALDKQSGSAAGITNWTPVTLTLAKNAANTAYVATKDVDLTPTTVKSTNLAATNTTTKEDTFVFKCVKSLKGVADIRGANISYTAIPEVTVTKTK